MAINLRGLCRLNISLVNNILLKPSFINVGRRSLYTERDMGITAYENTRFVFRNQFMTIEDTFRSKMKDVCEEENGMVYTEDLKAMLHLAQDTDEDMNLLIKMTEKYVDSKKEQKLGAYVFGPVMMRLFYYLNQPQRALNVFENENLSSFFNYRSSFRTLLCLLYKNNLYAEVRYVFEKILQVHGMDFIGSNSILLYATCYKQNTLESFEYALSIWKKEYESGKPSVRSSSLVAYLAIKCNVPETALEILSLVEKSTIMSVKNLKILAYLKLKRYMQVIPFLKNTLEHVDLTSRPLYFADVMYELEEKVNAEECAERKELQKLIEMIKSHNLLNTQSTLEEYLLRPIFIQHKDSPSGKETRYRNRYTSDQEKVGLKNYL